MPTTQFPHFPSVGNLNTIFNTIFNTVYNTIFFFGIRLLVIGVVKGIYYAPAPNRTTNRMGTYSSVFCLCLGLRFLSLSEEVGELIRRLLARRTNKSGDFVVVVVGSSDSAMLLTASTSLATISADVTDATVVVDGRLESRRLDSDGLVLTGDCRGLVGFDRGELYYVRHA